MDSLAATILRNLGLTGNGLATGSILTPQISPRTQDKENKEFSSYGEVANPDLWTQYNSTLRRPQVYEEMMQLWDEMSGYDLIASCLSEVTEEATQTDAVDPGTLWYECNDESVEDELNEMLSLWGVEDNIASQIWHIAAMGNDFQKIHYARGQGVLGLSYVHPIDVRRYWLKKNRRCIGFRWLGNPPDKSDLLRADGEIAIPRPAIGQGKTTEELWYPWDFMHSRRLYRHRGTEHGEPLYDDAQGVYKKMRIALDQMVIHRAQVQPDRYVINIDTKEQQPSEQMKTIQKWKTMFRKNVAFGAERGGPTFQATYNPLALDTVLYLAKPTGFEHSIDKLQGTPTIPDVYDVELLTNLLLSSMGMPKWWISPQDGGNPVSGKALLATDMRFLRKVKSVRKPIIHSYTWLAYFHCLLKGKDISQLEIKAKMSTITGLEEQQKLEVLNQQVGLLQGMGEVMKGYNLPREAWIDVVFSRYLNLPDDVVNVFLTSLPPEIEARELPESTARRKKILDKGEILAIVEKQFGNDPSLKRSKDRLLRAVKGIEKDKAPRYRCAEDVMFGVKLGELGKKSMLSESEIETVFKAAAKHAITEAEITSEYTPTTKFDKPAEPVKLNEAGKPVEPAYRKFMGPRLGGSNA